MGSPDAENPFVILGVRPGTPFEEIKKQYKKQAKAIHPDVDPSSLANARMKKLNWAYDEIEALYDLHGEDVVRHLHSQGKKKTAGSANDQYVDPVTESIAEMVIAMDSIESVQFEYLKRPFNSLASFTASCLVIFYILQSLAVEPFVNAYPTDDGPNAAVQITFWVVVLTGASCIWYPEFWLTILGFRNASEEMKENGYWGTQIFGWIIVWLMPFVLHSYTAENWVGKTQIDIIQEKKDKQLIIPDYSEVPESIPETEPSQTGEKQPEAKPTSKGEESKSNVPKPAESVEEAVPTQPAPDSVNSN